MGKETLAKRYERTMTRIEQITQAGYEVKIACECDFHREGIVEEKPELSTHPIVQQTALNTRDALYGVEQRPYVYTIRQGRIVRLCIIAM
jgi:G:T-mismatch repair DNA endonuclease (very short patch repair protein)